MSWPGMPLPFGMDVFAVLPAMTSSMRRIISATSDALLMACVFILSGSMTPACQLSMTLPVKTLMPGHLMVSRFALSSVMTSMGSSPAFSASVRGMTSSASANALTASCSLPESVSAYFLSSLLTMISGAPAPATIFPVLSAAARSPMASVSARLTSSTTCSVPPRMSIVTVFGLSHPVT